MTFSKVGLQQKVLCRSMVVFCLCAVCFTVQGKPFYRLADGGRVDIVSQLSSWGAGSGQEDRLSLSFWELGEAIRQHTMVRQGNVFSGQFKRFGTTDAKIELVEPTEQGFTYAVEYTHSTGARPPFMALTFNASMFARPFEMFLADGSVKTVSIEPAPSMASFVSYRDSRNPCVKIRIPLRDGFVTLSGFRSHQVLGPKYSPFSGNLQLYCNEDWKRGSLQVRVELEPINTEQIDLRPRMNRGFADKLAWDGKGGWTDEGETNDFRCMKSGRMLLGNMEFDIVDPTTNHGKSCVAMGKKKGFLNRVEIPLQGKTFAQLSLIHCCTWMRKGKVGTLTVVYADGLREKRALDIKRDVGNWWKPELMANAWPVWRGSNAICPEVGVYLSRFPVRTKPLKSLVLESTSADVRWLILALNGVLNGVTAFPPVTREQNVVFKESDWRMIRVPTPLAGSPMDFSFLQDAPAGKYGKVVIRNGRFEFANRPGVHARFYGGNVLADACLMTDEQLSVYIPRLKRAGYNAVRLHWCDDRIVEPGRQLRFNESALDRLFKTFAAFKSAGIYVTIDLYNYRQGGFPAGSSFEERKALCLLEPSYREDLKAFAKGWLTRKNPYTGVSIGEDPALLSIGLVNEDSAFFDWASINSTRPLIHEVFLQRYGSWCAKKGLEPDLSNSTTYSRFLTELHLDFYHEMRGHLRSLGIDRPVTDMNNGDVLMQYPVRKEFDYVDNHFYIDHPSFPNGNWVFPWEFQNRPAGRTFYSQIVHGFTSRIAGKPYVMSEYKYVCPNQWRLEAGPIVGALCGLQGVDAIINHFGIRFHKHWPWILNPEPFKMDEFDSLSDPVTYLGNKITQLLYLRGDMPTGKTSYALSLPSDLTTDARALTWRSPNPRTRLHAIPRCYERLALMARCGLVFDQPSSDQVFSYKELKPHDDNQLLKRAGIETSGVWNSPDGTIRTYPRKNRFQVMTAKTETITLDEEACQGKLLGVSGNRVFSTYCASAMDDKPLQQSQRILFLHVTDVQCGAKSIYKTYEGRLRIYSWDGYPFRLRKSRAQVWIKNSGSGSLSIHALSIDGKRLYRVPYTEQDGVIRFTVDNTVGAEPAVGYELVRD